MQNDVDDAAKFGFVKGGSAVKATLLVAAGAVG
jgi:hypothetical protein